MYLIIMERIKVKIDNVDHFEELLKKPNYTSGFKKEQLTSVCWYLAKMRNSDLYSNVYSIIDGFGMQHEQYMFYLNPLGYNNKNQIKVNWILKLDDLIIADLICKKEVKDVLIKAILSDQLEKNESVRLNKILLQYKEEK